MILTTINTAFFVAICVFAVIGVITTLLCLLYLVFGIIDLTYYDRHKPKDDHEKCPDKIERG